MNNDWREYSCYDLDYLAHHGILGQKWGVRRFENAAGHLTAAGRKRYTQINGAYQKVKKKVTANKVESTGKKTEGQKDEQKKGLSDKQKKMIIAGAAVAGTALAAYGGYKLYQLNKKATEGMANEYHQMAVKNITKGRKMESLGEQLSDRSIKISNSGNKTRGWNEYDKGMSLQKEGAFTRHLGEDQAYRAKNKDFTIKEKYDYLKGKGVRDDDMMKMHKELISKEQAKRASIQRDIVDDYKKSQQAKKAATQPIKQNTGNPYEKAPSSLSPVQKAAWNASVSLAKKLSSKTAQNGAKTVSSVTKMSGQTKFNQAAKANDDLVNDLLKKNVSMLSKF